MNLIKDCDYIHAMNELGNVLDKYGISTNEIQVLKHKIHLMILDKVCK